MVGLNHFMMHLSYEQVENSSLNPPQNSISCTITLAKLNCVNIRTAGFLTGLLLALNKQLHTFLGLCCSFLKQSCLHSVDPCLDANSA